MNMPSNRLDLGDVSLAFLRTAPTGPSVVLLHGLTDDSGCWWRLSDELETEHELIIPDARGHGRSSTPEDGYDYPTLARDLARLIKALKLEKPTLIGHSMGAETAALTAANYPDLIGAVVLEDPPWRDSHGRDDSLERAEDMRVKIEKHRQAGADELFYEMSRAKPDWHPQEVAAWVTAQQSVRPQVSQMRSSVYPDWRAMAASMRCRCLLLTGLNERGAIVTPEIARGVMTLLPQATHVQVEAGHNIHRDNWPRYIEAIHAFMGEPATS